MPKTTIQLDEKTKAQLTEEGKMGETYDQLILRLLIELERLRAIAESAGSA